MSYKAVGFDWGGVINGKPGSFFGESVSKLLRIPHDVYLEAYFHHNKKINRDEIDWVELWTLVLNELGKIDKLDEVMELSKEASVIKINTDIIELVDTLRNKGYRVGLLSNNTVEKAEKIRTHDIERHFDVFHISAETGFVKPDQKAFEQFAQDLGVELSELIFIDDSEKSLSTASECGYTPILFGDYSQLLNELNKLGIEV